MSNDPEILLGLSHGELEALAEGMLAPSIQARLDELIARSKQRQLSSEEAVEVDRLLARVDHLTLVKTRARYTMTLDHADYTEGQPVGLPPSRIMVPEDVLRAAERLGFAAQLPRVVEVSQELFGSAVTLRVTEDPELADWTHIALDVRLTGTVAEAVEKQEKWCDTSLERSATRPTPLLSLLVSDELLRGQRNRADYDLRTADFRQKETAESLLGVTQNLVAVLGTLRAEPVWSRFRSNVRTYAEEVLCLPIST